MPSLIYKGPDNTQKSLEFSSTPLIIGRVAESDIVVHDAFVSRVHCGIGYADSRYTLKDLGSTNGTYRNGARVFQCALVTGDRIQVGNTTLVFEIDGANGNANLRQVQQMVAPPGAMPGAVPSRPGIKQLTVPVNQVPAADAKPAPKPPGLKPV